MSDVPFDVLMKQAAALKTAQLASDRTKYDSWDSWYQHSLFSKEDVRNVRNSGSAEEKIEFARACKNKGSDHFREQDYDAAINEYERCLSVMDWVEPTDPDWKKKGIQDKMMVEKQYRAEDAKNPAQSLEELNELKLACILNLSMCFWKQKDWSQCIRACNRALEMDPQNTKALYRRAQARIVPPSCGMTENLMALEDLKKAVQIKPADSMLTSAYAELKIALSEQKKKDKKTFSNLFEREERISAPSAEDEANTENMVPAPRSVTERGTGDASTAVSTPGSSSARKDKDEKKQLTWQDAFDMVRDMECAAERLELEGQRAQAASIRAKKDELQKRMMIYFPKNVQSNMTDEHFKTETSVGARRRKGKGKGAQTGEDNGSGSGRVTTAAGNENPASWYEVCGTNEYDLVDFSNPTPAMIKDAQKKGLDLTDVRVQQLMQEINKVRSKHAKEEAAKNKGKFSVRDDIHATPEQMKKFMEEALKNIHTEEASRITSTMLTDVGVNTQRKMLFTRLRFAEFEREEIALAEEEAKANEYLAEVDDSGVEVPHEKRELPKIFDTEIDPDTCSEDLLASTLREMMIADIVDLRQVLEREAAELRAIKAHNEKHNKDRIRRGLAPQILAGEEKGSNTGIDGEVLDAEERARLSLSEQIVDMLEAKYGTAKHSGGERSLVKSLVRSIGIVGGIAVVMLFIMNIVIQYMTPSLPVTPMDGTSMN